MFCDMRLKLDSLMSQFSAQHLKRTKKRVKVGLPDRSQQIVFLMNSFLFT